MCRGYWVPGANEILGCPRNYFLFVSQNFCRPFLVFHQNFFHFSNLVIDPDFSLFRISCQISQKFATCMPPVLHHAPITTFFYSFWVIYPHFLRKLAPWMPPGWMPGAVASSAPPPSARHVLRCRLYQLMV